MSKNDIIIFNMDINTCLEGGKDYHSIAFYTHLIPLLITLVVSGFVIVKSKFSFLSKIFTLFTISFCFWLLGDVVLWTASDYDLIMSVWAPLDYLNILFFLFGAYFFIVLVKEKDISVKQKIFLFLFSIPGWWLSITNEAITIFNQPVCEATGSDFLAKYKLFLEVLIIGFILFFGFIAITM